MRQEINLKEALTPLMDDQNIMYAAKYPEESGLAFHGNVWTTHKRDGRIIHGPFDQGPNTFTTEGMADLLNTYFYGNDTPSAIYCGLFKNNVTPALADTAADKLGATGDYGECQDADYDDPATNRPAYTVAETSTASCTNDASKAEFTMDATITVYGAFLATEQAKTATTGVLICAKAFSSSRDVIDADELAIKYVISCTTS